MIALISGSCLAAAGFCFGRVVECGSRQDMDGMAYWERRVYAFSGVQLVCLVAMVL